MKYHFYKIRHVMVGLLLAATGETKLFSQTIFLKQEEIDAIAATPSGSYAYFGSPSSMPQDLPYIKHNLKTKLSVPHLDELCTLIAQGKTIAPVKTVEFALQEAAECLVPAHTALADQEILAIATRLEEYYKKFETGEFDLYLTEQSPHGSTSSPRAGEQESSLIAFSPVPLMVSSPQDVSNHHTRRIQDRTSKTFRNIDVRNTDTRYLAVARNAVIAGNLTVGGNQTIDGNLTVLGTINGSSGSGSSGNFVINGGQPGPVVVGTTDSTPLTFKTNNINNLSIDTNGAVTIPVPASGAALTVSGTASSPAVIINGAGHAGPLRLNGLQVIVGSTLAVDGSNNVGTLASSKRFKENFRALEDASGIYKLKPTIFDFKQEHSGEKDQIGFIAEEVKEIFPTMINHDIEGNVQSIRYDCFHALLVKELQEIRKTLNTYETRLQTQTKLIDMLMNKNNELKK